MYSGRLVKKVASSLTHSQKNGDSFVFVIDGGALVIIAVKLIDGIGVSE